MNKILLSSLVVFSCVVNYESKAVCPTLNSKDMAYYLCPGVGAYNPVPHTTVVYTRPSDYSIGGICANIKNTVSKALFGDENSKYKGIESNVERGKLVCDYKLPAEWKKKAGVEEFVIETTITTPPSLQQAACPVLTFSDMSGLMCQDQLQLGNKGPWWKVRNKNIKNAICNVSKGLINQFKSVSGTIKAQIDNTTTPFKHTCSYKYMSGSKTLVLNGVMSLDLLKRANN